MPTGPYVPVRWLIDTPNISTPGYFPLLSGQSFLQAKSPEWSTSLQEAKSGREFAVAEWSSPRWHFRVSYEVIRESLPTRAELTQLYEFFNLHMGQWGVFRYLEPSEIGVVNQFIGYGDGVNRRFQLTRHMGSWTEPVLATVDPPVVRVGGSVVTSGYAVSAYGVVVFDTAPASGTAVSWSGRSVYLCRFKQDRVDPAQMMLRLWSLDGLEFRSIKA